MMKNDKIFELTAKEFAKLSHEEKVKRYAEMSPHEQFIWRTQCEPLKGKCVGTVKMTDEEKEKYQQMLDDILREKGILKD